MPRRIRISETLSKNLDQFDEAIASHNKAIRFKPGFAGAHNNLGNTYNDLGRHEEAIASYSRAIQIRPDYAEAHSNLGNAFNDLGRYEEAFASYSKAIQIRPNAADVYVNMAALLVHLGRHEDAIANYAKAIEIRPDNVEAYCGLCGLLESLNRISEFKNAVRTANDRCASSHPSIMRLTGLLAFREKNYQEAKSILERIDATQLPESEQVSLFKLLGQVCDKLGDYGQAFQLFRSANAISARSRAVKKFEGGKFLKRIETLIQSYETVPARGWNDQDPGNSTKVPVLLVGFPRSGTTLLDTILMGHERISVIEEKPLVAKMVGWLDDDQRYERLSTLSQGDLVALSDIYESEEAKYRDGTRNADVVIDKHPFDLVNIALVNRVFPRAKVILALRHPCDCVLSCFMQTFRPNSALVNFLDLRDAAVLYDRVMSLWQAYEKALSFEHYVVKYEDLVEDLPGTVAPLLEFLGLPWDEKIEILSGDRVGARAHHDAELSAGHRKTLYAVERPLDQLPAGNRAGAAVA